VPSAPSRSPQQPAPAPEAGGDPAWYDIPGQVREAISDFLTFVAVTGLAPVLSLLGSTVLATPDLTGNEQVRTLWTSSLAIADSVFVLFVIVGGFTVAARGSVQARYGLKEVLPRIVLGGVAANLSLLLCSKIVWAANALTAAIAGQGVDGPAAAAALKQIVDNAKGDNNFLLWLLVLALLLLALVVIVTVILRIAAMTVLIAVGPLALMCHASPHTEALAHAWWRAVGACVGIQLGQAILVLATLRVFLTPAGPTTIFGVPASVEGWLRVLICLTMLWLLAKLPGWMRHAVLGPLGRRRGRGLVGQIIHTVLMIKTLGAAAGILGATATATATGSATRTAAGSATRGGTTARSAAPVGAGRARRAGSPARRARRPVPARRPSGPAGPVAFSDAPRYQVPLERPAGVAAAPVFSDAPRTDRPVRPVGGPPPVRFSDPPTPEATTATAPTAAPAPVVFSDHPAAARAARTPGSQVTGPADPARTRTDANTSPARPGPAPVVTFSAAVKPQVSPARPPAPVTPTFIAPPSRPRRLTAARPDPTPPPRRSPSSPAVPPASRSTGTKSTGRPQRRPRPAPGGDAERGGDRP
jgi:hypothetical protein